MMVYRDLAFHLPGKTDQVRLLIRGFKEIFTVVANLCYLLMFNIFFAGFSNPSSYRPTQGGGYAKRDGHGGNFGNRSRYH